MDETARRLAPTLRPPDARTRRTGRFVALDGLRGLAALVVVVGHVFLTSPRLAEVSHGSRDLTPVEWWISWTPLHLFWAGGAAVYVFFVLSGFVLTLPFLKPNRAPWSSYYPARLLRLYLPVWGAVALAAVILWAVPRHAEPGMSWWVAAHDAPFRGREVLGDASLVETGWANSPLWSLRFEVAFSLLLPAYLWIGVRLRNPYAATVAAAAVLAVCGLGSFAVVSWLVYMPMFGLGVLMCVHRDALLRHSRRMPSWAWPVVAALAVVLVTNTWIPHVSGLGTPGVLLGAALTVFLFLGCPAAIAFASTRPVQILGTLSFSLYLIHEPLLVSLAYLWPEWSVWLRLLVAVPLSLGAAWVFYVVVETRAHQLSKLVGRRLASRPSRPPRTTGRSGRTRRSLTTDAPSIGPSAPQKRV